MAAAFADVPEAVANTVDIARRCDFELRAALAASRSTRCRRARRSRRRSSATRARGLDERLNARRTLGCDAGRRGARTRSASPSSSTSSSQMGFAGYFLIVADFINWAKGQGIPVGPGPRLGGRQPGRLGAPHHRPRPDRARAALRALPEPRAPVDARHRRRLLLRAARRGDPLRAREVRRGPRRADHHLRDAQGEAGHQGRRPRPRLHLRRDRPHREALPGAEAGEGLPARARRSRWSRGCASCATAASASGSSSTWRCGSRACCATPPSTPPASSSRRGRSPTTCRSGSTRTARSSRSTPFTDVEAIGLIKFDFLGLKTLTLIDEHRAPHPRGPRRRRSTLDRAAARRRDDLQAARQAATRSASSSSSRAACAAADAAAADVLRRPRRRARALPARAARQRHGRASSSSASTARSRSATRTRRSSRSCATPTASSSTRSR